MKKLLLHTCCAPCALMPHTYLKDEFDLTLYFYNPNIHDGEEFVKRRDTFFEFVNTEEIPFFCDSEYKGMESWKESMPTLTYPQRCEYCYVPRLKETARKAKELDFEFFSTTLLYSRYQNQELIIEKGHEIAKEFGLEFLDRDFRPYWNDGINLSKEKKMYRQKYCGCGLPYK